ncbi:DUF4369 domain-containing protein [Lutibacter flavus]|uniref:DUF4369 domain-containing protein n=1 Tax=Lutibacter flavus TaxID=691689 RepID=A0A238VSR8_9FLAO|nr:DUF4369 domain-containing protein [Lutibacter flavus]SNR37276.1 protein of unknown function [Lutibacter flavus]
MRFFFIFCILTLSIFSCKKQTVQKKKLVLAQNKVFTLNGTLENFYPKKVFLNKIIENSIYVLDSSNVIDNKFTIKGFVEYPERFALSFNEYSATVVLIIENSDINIKIDAHNLEEPLIKGSELNSKLSEYKLNSKKIFKKIEYLFPQFQKYRLENNAEKLEDLGIEMSKIEQEYIDYSFNFIEKNRDSYIAPMILRDQLKNSKIDTLKIINTFNQLSDKVKKSPDSQIIELLLNLH